MTTSPTSTFLESMNNFNDISKEKYTKLKAILKEYTTFELILIMATALTGANAIISSYNAASGIEKNIDKCFSEEPLKTQLRIQFIVLLVISCLFIILGVVMSFILADKPHFILINISVIVIGILGLLYSIYSRFLRSGIQMWNLAFSWFLFLVLLGFSYFWGNKKYKDDLVKFGNEFMNNNNNDND